MSLSARRVRPRGPSPLNGAKPTTADLPRFASSDPAARDVDDVLPFRDPETGQWSYPVELLIVGVNPGLWTAAVNGPFARPGNRFWPSLHRAGLTGHVVDCSRGLSAADEEHLAEQGLGLTNLCGRATVRADELSREELVDGGQRVIEMTREHRPGAVAVAGITAFRVAYQLPKAQLGPQDPATVPGWPEEIPLWALPQPSGLNAHETIDTLAAKWRAVWAARVTADTAPRAE